MSLATTITVLLLQIAMSLSQNNDLNMMEELFKSLSTTYQQYNHKNMQPPDWNYWMKTQQYAQTKQTGSHQYDFIIVGSGSAGAIIANRLSEVPHWKVLLLEAGKGENQLTRIPLIAPVFQFTHYDWHYLMEPQPNMCMGLEGQRMYWPRGRALGGSTVINYMIYTRGNPIDYDRWEKAGNPGWSYKDVLPYFMKSENAKLKYGDSRYHGKGGYQSVEDIYQSPLVEAFIKAGKELGLPQIDYNAPEQPFGVSTIQATVKNGQRHSVARAFLQPVKQRDNLHILTSAFVRKILIDPVTKQAYGVEFERFGRKYSISASKEVILSAGALNSPQLLMLSGIGPKNHLQDLGIPVIRDLAVGQNLHDHTTFPGMTFTFSKGRSIDAYDALNLLNILQFKLNGAGPITSLGGVEGIAYIKTEASRDKEDYPDIELLFVDGSLASDFGVITRRTINIKDAVYNALFRPIHHVPSWTISPMLLHPKSIGYMKLRSGNPRDPPKFYGNYFSDRRNEDMKTFLASIRFIQKMARTEAFTSLGSELIQGRLPGCEHHEFDSDEYWLCALRSITITVHHQVGTAKMGPENDTTAVVDHKLRVHGVKGLRVADCSIIPFALSAHTNAPSMMVGEKAADMIKDAWK